MKLRDLQKNKYYVGNRIHIYAIRGDKRIDLFQSYISMIPVGLLEYEIMVMTYKTPNALEVKINW